MSAQLEIFDLSQLPVSPVRRQLVNLDHWLPRIPATVIDSLRLTRRVWARQSRANQLQWKAAYQADVDSLIEEVLKSMGDPSGYVNDALAFDEIEAESILSHLSCGNYEAMGRLLANKIRSEYGHVMEELVSNA